MIISPLKRLFVLIVFAPLLCTPTFVNAEPLSLKKQLATLEASMDGKIGVFALNTANNQQIEYRSDEHFPIQSTFKVMVVAAILKQSMTDKHLLQQKITYSKKDMVFWSPITEQHLVDGMTLLDLCSAAMIHSDNTATNLIVNKLGGPQAVIAFARSIKNTTFRLDNWEPNLNSNPKNLHDSSTPAEMAKSLQKLTLGTVLARPQQEQLITWMKGNKTGDTRIRAGVPKGWIVADKTGSGSNYGIANDIGIIWPPKGAPIVIAIYSVHKQKNAAAHDDLIASVTRLVMKQLV